MNELAQALIAESYAAPPSHILEGLTDELVHRELPNTPHTIYAELWHIAFWQRITLHWIAGIETPYPAKASDGFPQMPSTEPAQEPWEQLRHRFLQGCEHAAAAARTSPVSTIPSAAHPAPALPPASCPWATSSSRSPPTTPTTSAASSFFANSFSLGPRLRRLRLVEHTLPNPLGCPSYTRTSNHNLLQQLH